MLNKQEIQTKTNILFLRAKYNHKFRHLMRNHFVQFSLIFCQECKEKDSTYVELQ